MNDERGSERNKQLAWLFLLIGILSFTDVYKQGVATLFGTAFTPALLMVGNLMVWIAIFMFIAYEVAHRRDKKTEPRKYQDKHKESNNENTVSNKSSFPTRDIRDLQFGSLSKPVKLSKKTSQILLASSFMVLIIGFGAYWFAVRPAVAKKECHNLAVEKARGAVDYQTSRTSDYINGGSYTATTAVDVSGQAYLVQYQACLAKKGL